MEYDETHLTVLSADNRVEMFKVNVDNRESLVKKLMRTEKRKVLKRMRHELDDEDESIKDTKIDKDLIVKKVEDGEYDMGLHFSKKFSFEIPTQSKVRSILVQP